MELEFKKGRKRGSRNKNKRNPFKSRPGLFIGGGAALGVLGTSAYFYRKSRKKTPIPVLTPERPRPLEARPYSESPEARKKAQIFDVKPYSEFPQGKTRSKPVKPNVESPDAFLRRPHSRPNKSYSGPQRYLPSKYTKSPYKVNGKFAQRPVYQMEISQRIVRKPTQPPLNLKRKKKP